MPKRLAPLLALHLAGCALARVHGPPPPPYPAEPPVACTEASGAMTADEAGFYAAMGVGLLGLTLATARPTCGRDQCIGSDLQGKAAVAAAVLLPAGILFGASAVVGQRRTLDCRRAHGLQGRCLEGDQAACEAIRGPRPPAPGAAPPAPGP